MAPAVRRHRSEGLAVLIGLLSSVVAGSALGQVETATVTTTATICEAPSTPSDHQAVVGRFGVGFEGGALVPEGITTGGFWYASVSAVTARWWWSERLGFELALGFGYNRGSGSERATVGPLYYASRVSEPAAIRFTVRVGAPYALYVGQHVTLLALPQVLFGYARARFWGQRNGADAVVLVDGWGYRLEAALQAGAELHFGFLGMPELALQGMFGVSLRHNWATQRFDPEEWTLERTTVEVGETNSPLDFFRTAVSARYYF